MQKIDSENIGVNPFVESLRIKAVHVVTINKMTGDTVVDYLIDEDISVKMFRCANAHQTIANLSNKAQRLLFYIIYSIHTNCDYILLNKSYYKKINKIKSNTTITTAIGELVRTGIIAKSCIRDVYFINPRFLFNGNRIKNYQSNVDMVRVHKIKI